MCRCTNLWEACSIPAHPFPNRVRSSVSTINKGATQQCAQASLPACPYLQWVSAQSLTSTLRWALCLDPLGIPLYAPEHSRTSGEGNLGLSQWPGVLLLLSGQESRLVHVLRSFGSSAYRVALPSMKIPSFSLRIPVGGTFAHNYLITELNFISHTNTEYCFRNATAGQIKGKVDCVLVDLYQELFMSFLNNHINMATPGNSTANSTRLCQATFVVFSFSVQSSDYFVL